MRSLTTRAAAATQPTVMMRCFATQPALTTQPTVLMRSLAIPPAITTQPTVLMRSYTTQPAAATLHWALQPAIPSLRAVITSISATQVFLATQTGSASEREEPRLPHLSLALVEQQLPVRQLL